jgi:hypothetical protein
MLVVLVAACSGDPVSSSVAPAPSVAGSTSLASTTPSADDSPAASEPNFDPDIVGPGDVVQVVADGLQLRSAAGTGSDVVGGLERGAVARVESGPVESDGFSWYEVLDLESNRGWVAAGDAEDAWLAARTDQPDGGLVVRYEVFGHVSPTVSMPLVTVMDDRRVVMGDGSTGWSLWHLTDAGFDRLTEEVLESPYLQESAEYQPVLQAGVTEGPPHGTGIHVFTIGTEAEPIVVRSVQWFGEAEEAAFYVPSPQRRALEGVAAGLSTLGGSLGEDAWVTDPLTYVADRYMVWVGRGSGEAPPGTPQVDAGAVLGSTSLGNIDDLAEPLVCSDITLAEAFELARLMRGTDSPLMRGTDSPLNLDRFSSATFASDDAWFSVSLSPHTPDGFAGCDDIGLPA